MNKDKHKHTLPCISFISCGVCPYKKNCHFCHPTEIPELEFPPDFIYNRKYSKNDRLLYRIDHLFKWPSLFNDGHVTPNNSYSNAINDSKDKIIRKMWYRFINFLDADSKEEEEENPRLPIFTQLYDENKKHIMKIKYYKAIVLEKLRIQLEKNRLEGTCK